MQSWSSIGLPPLSPLSAQYRKPALLRSSQFGLGVPPSQRGSRGVTFPTEGYSARWRFRPPHRCLTSGLNQLKCRVEAFQLDAGIGGCKAPVSFDIVSVAVEEPGGNLALEAAPIRDTPIEALIGQDSELRLGHSEPAAVLGGVVPFEALDEAPCLQGGECLVE